MNTRKNNNLLNSKDVESFEPAAQETKTPSGAGDAPKPEEESVKEVLARLDDNALIQELTRRGWRGTLERRQTAILGEE